MPSASAKIEKVPSPEAADPVKMYFNFLEKKIRNLEKRKSKLDNYRNDVNNGKDLNDDQKMAVSKYDNVVELLDFSKEIHKSLTSITQESLRLQKKLAKKEQIERQQHEIHRLKDALYYKHILSCMDSEEVRSDFLNGENGAVKISEEDMEHLDQFYKILGQNLPNDQADNENHFHMLAESMIFLVEGKNKEVAGTTYKVLKELLQGMKESGYFSRSPETINDEVSSDEVEEVVQTSEETPILEDEITVPVNGECVPELVEDIVETDDVMEPKTVEPVDVENDDLNADDDLNDVEPESNGYGVQNGSLQDVLASQGNFNFLQESQIELDTPHMDPAVVAVHQMAPPTQMSYPVNTYPMPQVSEDQSQVNNGIEEHNSVASLPDPQQVPLLASTSPHTMGAVLSVQHNGASDFDPTHPIPTQTFTNQSFAIMQNMIMPQAYVPVTMHHGPLPPHIVVPTLSPSVTTPTSTIPLHVTVAPMPVMSETSPVATLAGDLSKPEYESQEDEHAMVNGGIPIPEESQNGCMEEKNDSEGFTTQNNYQKGYRGRGRGRGSINGYYRGRGGYSNNRGGYQGHNYYQNGNFRRGNFRGGRGNGNPRGRGTNYRLQQQQQTQQQYQQQQ